mmetsp:Transcript_39309/g.62265  ORF Transcript_39309/g.62265 Transcript_39309/m.62265 type:complete len:296 (+) Transcript_39309:64-951(+)
MMASRVVASFIIAASLQGTLGANLHDNGHMMRHERKEAGMRALEMDPDGVMEVSPNAEFAQNSPANQPGISKDDQSNGDDYCDYDYTFGHQNSNFCDANKSITSMSDLEDNECIFAATKAGAHQPNAGFEIPQEWDDVHPKGCFTFPCGDKAGWCYFENEDGAIPSQNLTGYPVCRRWRYLNGQSVAGAAIDDHRICPDPANYMVVAGEDDCRKAASCLGDCAGEEFRIGIHNASKRDEFPPGCFLHQNSTHDRACVYWNDPQHGTNHPTMPQGTPICVVRSSDHTSSLGPGGTR